jgi:hypothetical protein
MPAKKTPAKKAAPRKKSAKKVTKSGTNSGFKVKYRQGLTIVLIRGTNPPSAIPSGTQLQSGDVILWRNSPPPPQELSGNPDVYVEKSGTIGLGFNIPAQGQPLNLNMNLSIFQSLTNNPRPSNIYRADHLDAAGSVIFNIGIEG